MTDEKKYSLAEAQRELIRRDCSPFHKPYSEVGKLGHALSIWYCHCGDVVYEPKEVKYLDG